MHTVQILLSQLVLPVGTVGGSFLIVLGLGLGLGDLLTCTHRLDDIP